MSKLLALLATVAPILLCLSACSATYVVRPITMEAVEQLKAEALNHSVVVDYTGGTRAKPAAASAPRPAVAQGEEIGSDKTVLRGVSLDWMTFGTPTDRCFRGGTGTEVGRVSVGAADSGAGAALSNCGASDARRD